jgi:hypothetical protein
MKWKIPGTPKVFEALGCIIDNRIEIKQNTAKVYSSTKNKFYNVKFEADSNTIYSNDNSSYYTGYLGYPSIAFLMKKEIISYDEELAKSLKEIEWKDLNQKYKNDYDATIKYVQEKMIKDKPTIERLNIFAKKVINQLKKLDLNKPESLAKPPEGY